jgi:hypothetical protein
MLGSGPLGGHDYRAEVEVLTYVATSRLTHREWGL